MQVMAEPPNNEINLAGNQVDDGELGAQALNAAIRKDDKKRKKQKREKDGGNIGVTNDGGIDGKDVRNEMECLYRNITEKVEHLKNEKKEKKKKHDGLEGKDFEKEQGMVGDVEASDSLEKSTRRHVSKKVSFSEDVVIFPSFDGQSDEETSQAEELGLEMRFTYEEDQRVKAAVLHYIFTHKLGREEGLKMVLQYKKYPALKNCWEEIGDGLPWRINETVYNRARILFERDEKHTWSLEELALVLDFHEMEHLKRIEQSKEEKKKKLDGLEGKDGEKEQRMD